MDDYQAFLATKAPRAPTSGFSDVPDLSAALKPFQAAMTSWALRRGRAAIFAGTGLGKAQPSRSCALTPTGWKMFRDIVVGDRVIGSNGKPTEVTGVFPQGEREVYRVGFTDGTMVHCDEEHLWAVQSKKDRHRDNGYKVITLAQIGKIGLRDGLGWRHFIPTVEPVAFEPEGTPPLHPYLVGALIGDGGLTAGCPYISSADDELLETISGMLPKGVSLKWASVYDWRITGPWPSNQWSPNPLTKHLQLLGLWGKKSEKKFIPDIYKFSTVDTRMAILQGILDTDGHIRPADNNIEFCTVSEELAKDVQFVVQSLGGLARINTKQTTGQLAYRMSVQLPPGAEPFRLRRKADVYHDREKYQPRRAIASIEATGEKDHMICISVAALDHLYVTNGCVVTHNTLMQLEWARVVAEEHGNVLILCPLAVAEQTVAEAAKFGIEGVAYAADQRTIATDIVVTNYERFDKFDVKRFSGIVLDESGIIKSHDGKTRQLLTKSCHDVPWKLCCTATPAPNDYTELGQHAEFLGVMDAKEMLAMFFVHDGTALASEANRDSRGWRLKGHAINDFWRWIASWSVMVRHPRDLGFEEPGYDLPPLNLHQVTVAAEYKPTAGELFPMQASTLAQRIGVRRDTAMERVNQAVEIVLREPEEPWLIFCNLNSEADAIEKALPNCLQVAGRDSPEIKVARLLGFKTGHPLWLATKGSIAAHGMNYQHCARLLCVGLTDSFEMIYQGIRRVWRFGQDRPVEAYFIASELEGAVVANLKRKEVAFDKMLDAMSDHMRDLMRANVLSGYESNDFIEPRLRMELPTWIS